jgi:hypothetical protein
MNRFLPFARFPRAAWLPAVALVAFALAGSPVQAEGESPPPSAAEKLLFMEPNLDGMKAPTTLRYQFVHNEASPTANFKDIVEIQFARGKAVACCTVSGTFLTGERAMRPPEVEDARSNPVLMYFLEYEVRQLQRATKGGQAHFRKQIRLSFVDKAEVTPTRIQWGGREVDATTVQVSPFLDDPFRARFEREAQKVYTFVLSNAVPGGIYQIRSRLPDPAAGTTLAEETLTLQPR